MNLVTRRLHASTVSSDRAGSGITGIPCAFTKRLHFPRFTPDGALASTGFPGPAHAGLREMHAFGVSSIAAEIFHLAASAFAITSRNGHAGG